MKDEPRLVRQNHKIKRSFSPFYLAILSGILLIILIVNGLLEINRTRNGFYLLLEREALVLLQHYEKNILDALSTLQLLDNPPPHLPPSFFGAFDALEESVAEYLVDLAHRIDQRDGDKPLSPEEFQAIASQYLLASLEIYDAAGHWTRGWPPPSSPFHRNPFLRELIERRRSVVIDVFGKPLTGEGQWFSVAILRERNPGIISLQLDSDRMRRLLRQFSLQKAISDIGFREGVQYVSVQDAQYHIVAHTDPSLLGTKEEEPFLKTALQSSRPLSRLRHPSKESTVFEVAKSFSFRGSLVGVIRIGYSPGEIHSILRQIQKTVALSIFFFLLLGISAIALIWINQNRHLQKVKEMGDRIQLAERLSSLGHLAAGVAHEIRNPLNAIGMGIQRIKREFSPQEGSRRDEFLSFMEIVLKEIRRVNQIIEQFLTLSRPFQLTLRECSMRDLLINLVTLLREELTSQRMELKTEIDPNLPSVQIDEEKLTQALINIMKNGIQSMEEGGVLRVGACASKDRVEIQIADTGTGIPPDQMEKIFNYYYTTKEKGVGLGLPIAHRIIEAHQGQLSVESVPGRGTRVTILLPVSHKSAPHARSSEEGVRSTRTDE